MKKFLVTLLAIGCVATLVIGNQYWKERTSVSAENTQQEAGAKQPKAKKVRAKPATEKAQNWPAPAIEQYELAVAENRHFTILLAGSLALGTDENGWSSLLQAELEKVYGDTIKVVVKSYDVTSADFLNGGHLAELVDAKPDMTLLEPFTLKNNGVIANADANRHIAEISDALLEANPDHVLLLQPPYPIYGANFYPLQVNELKKYAEEEEITYLDHWETWPDPNNEEIKDYLTSGQDNPNEAGHQLWADYLIGYFIAE